MLLETMTSIYRVERYDDKYVVIKLAVKTRSSSGIPAGEKFEGDRIVFDERGHLVLEKKIGDEYVQVMNATTVQF